MTVNSDRPRIAPIGLMLAPMLPLSLAFNLPPSPTLVGQCLALGMWGAAIVWLSVTSHPARMSISDARWLHLSSGICILGGVLSVLASAWPISLAMSTVLTLLAFSAVVQLTTDQTRQPARASEFAVWFLLGIVVAGVLNGAIGVVQVVWPGAPDGDWVARSGLAGRAVGNLRQPNHLSSLLLWSVIAAVGLFDMGRLRGRWALGIGVCLLAVLVLTGSRTGILGTLLLAVWGGLDRRLPRGARWALAAAPIAFGAMWLGAAIWAHATGHVFGSEGRLALGNAGDISSSRYAIWSNTLSMIRREPLLGVGLGEFNLAWTLSAFPNRPTAFFDHAHNLPLQLLVELGVPMGSLVIALLVLALCQAWRRAWGSAGEVGSAKRSAFMLVLMIGLHSLLEYPLWYAYFLLPAAFAWGFALSRPEAQAQRTPGPTGVDAQRRAGSIWLIVGTTMALGALTAVLDYRNVVAIYEPPDNAEALEERIVRGQRSPLFGHHADYAAATAFAVPQAAPLPAAQQLAFRRAPHQLLDVRLMIAWAQALAVQGELDKARWLAARIREFRNSSSDEFFAPCGQQRASNAFQCQPPPAREVDWREFTR